MDIPGRAFRSHHTSWRTYLRLPVIWSDLEMNTRNERTTGEEIDIKVVNGRGKGGRPAAQMRAVERATENRDVTSLVVVVTTRTVWLTCDVAIQLKSIRIDAAEFDVCGRVQDQL